MKVSLAAPINLLVNYSVKLKVYTNTNYIYDINFCFVYIKVFNYILIMRNRSYFKVQQ